MSSNNIKRYTKIIVLSLGFAVGLASCEKDDYYRDGGLADPNFDCRMLEYLQSKPVEFDTIAQLINLDRLEDVFQTCDVTFIAPSDTAVKELIVHVGHEETLTIE